MKKILLHFLAFALILSLVLGLCACGNSSDDPDDTPTEDSGNDNTGENPGDDPGNDNTGDNNQGGEAPHEHKYEIKTVAPTCTEDGYVANYCAECGDEEIVEVIYAFGHKYDNGYCAICGEAEPVTPHEHEYEAKTVAATCTEDGYVANYCAECGDEEIVEVIYAFGHKYDNGYCAICGEPESEVPHKHEYETIVVDPTCTEDGYVANYCAECGDEQIVEVRYALGHNVEDTSDIIEVNPTCESEGYRCNVCSICSEQLILETIPALGHKYADGYCAICGEPESEVPHKHQYETIVVDATCTEDGYVANYCAECGDEEIVEVIYAFGHRYDNGYCAICGEPESEVPHKHEYETIVVDPTCTEDGYVADYCAECGAMEIVEVIYAFGHRYDNGYCAICGEPESEVCIKHEFETVEIFPTCVDNGYIYMTCSICGYEQEPIITEPYGHYGTEIFEEPTCETEGYRGFVCEICGYKDIYETLPALGHEYSYGYCINCETPADPEDCEHLYENTICDATCLEDGYMTSICVYCADSKEEILYAEGHKYDQDSTCTVCGFSLIGHECTNTRTTEEDRKEATSCGDKGSYVEVVTCLECGEEVSRTTVTIPSKILHTPNEDSVIENEIKATCTSSGSYDEVVYCTVCNGEISRETTIIPNLIHIPKDSVKENEIAATCTSKGSYDEVVYCALCNVEQSRENFTTDMIPHDYVDGVCSKCEKLEPSENLLFEFDSGNNTYTVKGIGDCTDTIVVIPDEYEGYPVTEIAENAFKDCTAIEGVVIPNSVTAIGDYAFRNCSKLTSVNIPYAVKSIGDYAFQYCSGLTSIYIYNTESIGDYAFSGCSSLTSIIIPNSTTSIGKRAFENCSSLTNATIGNWVKNIGEKAFFGCSSLESITIPFVGNTENGTSNTHFGYIFGASSYSSNNSYVPNSLKKVVITGGSKIADNAFFGCSNITSITVPDSVTSIGSSAFYGCSSLTSITIPNSVTSIGGSAFYGCSSLTSIDIPSSVRSIGSNAFYYCSSLTSVNIFNVTKWCEITFSDSLSNPLYYAGNLYFKGNLITEFIIPDSVTTISKYAFYGCSSFTNITIPNSVTSIGEDAFRNCSNLTGVNITDVAKWCGISCGNTYANPLYYAGNLYLNGKLVSELIIPDSVTTISEYSFYGCSSLTSVTIPDSVTSIGFAAFNGCTSLETITIPFVGNTKNGTKSTYFGYIFGVESGWDYNKIVPKSIKKVVITGGDVIADYAFFGCNHITSITIPNSVTSIGDNAFRSCSSLTSIHIPDGVTSIGEYAFYGCSGLTCLSFGDNPQLQTIPSYAFANCSGLSSVIIPDGIKSICSCAFDGCSSLTSIYIPDSVTIIEEFAFTHCYGLTIYCEVESQPSGWSDWHRSDEDKYKYYLYPVVWNCNNNDVASDGYIYTVVDGIRYVIKDGVAKVTTQAHSIVNVDIPSEIIYNGTMYSVTSISYSAFEGCLSLTTVVIPSSVTSIGVSTFKDCSSLTTIEIPNSITSIGDSAFEGCSCLTSITIPESVTSIGPRAFRECTMLTNVYFSDNCQLQTIAEYTFFDCRGLTSITIPNSITSIGDHALAYCTGLTSVTIPDSIISIAYAAFRDCSGLTNLYFGDDCQLKTIVEYTFANCTGLTTLTIPDSVTSINEHAFRGCTNLTNVTLLDNVARIGGGAFYDCSSLENITLPFIGETKDGTSNIHFGYIFGASSYDDNSKNVPFSLENVVITGGDIIADYAFYGCNQITSITLPNSVTIIGSHAFERCRNLINITIPNIVTSIGDLAFKDCENLINMTIPNSVTSIGDSVFNGCASLESITIPYVGYDTNQYPFGYLFGTSSYVGGVETRQTYYDEQTNVDSVQTYYIPVTLMSVTVNGRFCPRAFINCFNITSVIINDEITSIPEYAFYGCSNLTNVTIGKKVRTIGDRAFYKCSNLVSIRIPSSVISIGDGAFDGCSKLVEIINLSTRDMAAGSENYGNVAYYAIEVHKGESKIVNYEDYLFYTYDNVNYLVGYVGTDTVLVLPDSYNGEEYVINKFAFYNNKSIISVNIPNSVTNIYDYAFSGCYKLVEVINHSSLNITAGSTKYGNVALYAKEVHKGNSKIVNNNDYLFYVYDNVKYLMGYIGEDTFIYPSWSYSYGYEERAIYNYAFFNNYTITGVQIDSTTTIGDYAFYGCCRLTHASIGDKTTLIGSSVFEGCCNLETLKLPFVGATKSETQNTHFGYIFGAYSYEYNSEFIPLSLTTVVITSDDAIDDYAFYGCSNITEITISDSVTSIGEHTFDGCNQLITVENGVHYVDRWVIDADSNIASVVLRGNTIGIIDYAFSDCSKLVWITVPDSVTSIGKGAFSGCSSLKSITLPFIGNTKDGTSNTHFGYIFGASSSSDNSSHIPKTLNTVTITNATRIDSYAFYNCYSITSITIPDSVTYIGDSAFNNCYSITSITIPDSVTYIGDSAFRKCSSLTNVYYGGTADDWSKIFINPHDNYNLTGATRYYYSATKPTVEGNYWHYVDGKVVVW